MTTDCKSRGCSGCPFCDPELAELMRLQAANDTEGALTLLNKRQARLFPGRKFASSVRTPNEVPSPDAKHLEGALTDPRGFAKRTVQYERDTIQTRTIERPIDVPSSAPDLAAAIREHKQGAK